MTAELILALALIAAAAFFLLRRKVRITPPPPGVPDWRIGAVIDGRNSSVGMPARPTPEGQGWYFDFPQPDRKAGHVHYVQLFPSPLLIGASSIALRFRIEAAEGVTFHQQERPGDGYVSLIIQRRGDKWKANAEFEHYRWWRSMMAKLEPGVVELTVPLHDGLWISVNGKRSADHPQAFLDALADAENIGLTFGGEAGLGHGAYATGPARFHLEWMRADV